MLHKVKENAWVCQYHEENAMELAILLILITHGVVLPAKFEGIIIVIPAIVNKFARTNDDHFLTLKGDAARRKG